MGTHPIFESDFDCLTEKKRMNLYSPHGPKYLIRSDKVTSEEKFHENERFSKIDEKFGLSIWQRSSLIDRRLKKNVKVGIKNESFEREIPMCMARGRMNIMLDPNLSKNEKKSSGGKIFTRVYGQA